MFFTDQITELIEDERKAYRSYLLWLVLILLVGSIFIALSLVQNWLNDLGPTLSSGFLLLLSKPPFTEMMKRREKIKTLKSLQKMALLAGPDSKESTKLRSSSSKHSGTC